MGRLLQVGVYCWRRFVMLIGGVIYVKAHQGSIPDYRVFNSEPQGLRHVDGVISGVASWRSGSDHSTRSLAADRNACSARGVCADRIRY